MKRRMIIAVLAAACVLMMAGCNKTAKVEEPVPSEADEQYIDEEEFIDEDEYPEDYPDDDYYEEEYAGEEEDDSTQNSRSLDIAAGTWYTEDYDVDSNWAGSYMIELTPDGKASCTGWRNKDTGTYEVTGDDKALITFDHCETDNPGEGFQPVDNFKYTIEMTIKGDDARITIDAPDVISNLENGTVHRKNMDAASGKKSESGQNPVEIKDGKYTTDPKYSGELSADGKTLRVTTALSHYDNDGNEVLDYEKQEFVFSTTDDCKCIVFDEDEHVYPLAEKIDFINEFLEGKSGLPLTFDIVDNKIEAVVISS